MATLALPALALTAACGRFHFDPAEPTDATDAASQIETYIKASNPGVDDEFGWRLALSADGDTLAVGAINEDSATTGIGGDQASNSALDSGAVYVFARAGTTWAQQAYVKPSNTEAGDEFGWSLALSSDGGTLVVGAHLEDSATTGIDGDGTDNSAIDSGAIYLFTRTGTAWSQQAYVKPSLSEAARYFGHSVSLSSDGGTLAVGAHLDDTAAADGGAVYVFTRAGATWSQEAVVVASKAGANDQFGWRVELSGDGNTLAVGSVLEDSGATGIGGNDADDSALDSGAVYAFSRAGTTWSQQGYLKASNTDPGDTLGWAVELSADGNTIAAGAPLEDSAATGIGGNAADNSATDSGAAYVFVRVGTTWSQQAYVKASNTDAGDQFGFSTPLSFDADTLAVGAFYESSAAIGIGGERGDNSAPLSGAVYLYNRAGTTWSQDAYVKASNTDAGDGLGHSTALSAYGRVLAVGANLEASAASGVGGDQADNTTPAAGAVYIIVQP